MSVAADVERLQATYAYLRKEMRDTWNRILPLGDLVEDRWSRADSNGFGSGSSIYDSAVVLGDVSVGHHCWIGPFTYLDGAGGLIIGNYVTVGAGTMIASHSSVLRNLSGGRLPDASKRVKIGSYVFMRPIVSSRWA